MSWEAEAGDSSLLPKSRRIPNPHDSAWREPSRVRPSVTTSTTATTLGCFKDV